MTYTWSLPWPSAAARARLLPFRRQRSSMQHRHEHHPQLHPLTAFDRRPEMLKEVIAHTLEEEVLSSEGDLASWPSWRFAETG